MCVRPAAAGRLPFSNNQCKLLSKSCEKSDTHIRFRITHALYRASDTRSSIAIVAAAHSVDLARFALLLGAGVRPRRRLPTTRGVRGGQVFRGSALRLRAVLRAESQSIGTFRPSPARVEGDSPTDNALAE